MTIILGHQDLVLGAIGIRSLLVPCAFFIIGITLRRNLGLHEAAIIINKTFTFWLIIIGIVMIAQLLVGREHWLNALPDTLGGDGREGIGDYTVGEVSVYLIFRPVSIFLHTGKLGSVVFVLATFRLFYAFSKGLASAQLMRSVILDIMLILVTGQRAAIIGYFIALIICLVLYTKTPLKVLSYIFAIFSVCYILLNSYIDVDNTNIGMLFLMRAASGLSDISTRGTDNLIAPANYVWDAYALTPAGAGAFSLGAESFGGKPLYDVVPNGTAENSWLRLLAEEGFVGLIGNILFWGGLFIYIIFSYVTREKLYIDGKQNIKLILLGAAYIIGILLLWANTHDILGNSTVMSLCMLVAGAIGSLEESVLVEFNEC